MSYQPSTAERIAEATTCILAATLFLFAVAFAPALFQ